jgi:hypothetical protein
MCVPPYKTESGHALSFDGFTYRIKVSLAPYLRSVLAGRTLHVLLAGRQVRMMKCGSALFHRIAYKSIRQFNSGQAISLRHGPGV